MKESTWKEAFDSVIKDAENLSSFSKNILDGGRTILSEAGQAAAIGFGVAVALSPSSNSRTDDNKPLKGLKFSEGVAYNSNPRATFRGDNQQQRTVRLQFELSPKSEEEVKKIRRAEYIFSTNVLPSLWKGTFGLESKYINHFKFPSKVNIEIFVDNKPLKHFKFLDCVIADFEFNQNTDLSEDDFATFIKNDKGEIFASSFEVSMQIHETKIFTRNDAEEVYN